MNLSLTSLKPPTDKSRHGLVVIQFLRLTEILHMLAGLGAGLKLEIKEWSKARD